MPGDVAKTLTQSESRFWYPLHHLTAIYEHIVDAVGKGAKNVLEDLGAYIAEVDLGGILKPIVAFISLPRALGRTPYLWPKYDDSGEFKVLSIDTEGKNAELELADYDGGPLHCIIIRSWLHRGCELMGEKDVSVEETECKYHGGTDNSCRWSIKWK